MIQRYNNYKAIPRTFRIFFFHTVATQMRMIILHIFEVHCCFSTLLFLGLRLMVLKIKEVKNAMFLKSFLQNIWLRKSS